MFPRKALLKAKDWRVDMTTSIGCPFVPKFQVSNITAFNTSAFDSWKSAFRECTKLSSSIIENGDNVDNEYRLDVWKTRGKNRPFGLECTLGAKQGADFGFHYRGQVNILNKINDFDWLHETYEEAMADHKTLTEAT